MTLGHRIAIANCGAAIVVAADTTILQAALDEGIAYPHGCRMGRCGTCKSRLVEGEVDLLPHTPFALTAADKARGLVLACRAQPRSDCKVAWLGSDSAEHAVRTATGRVTAIRRAAPDTSVVSVALDGAPLEFSAGQHAEVRFAGCPPRNYAMASQPGEPELVFHVRHADEGAAGKLVASHLAVGDPVALHGPMGDAYLRKRRPGVIIAVADGAGLAQILSVLGAAAALQLLQPIRLYFAARTGDDLYQQREIAALAERLPDLTYVQVTGGHDVLIARLESELASVADLAGATAYVAGTPALVEEAVRTLAARGLAPAHAYAAAFPAAAQESAAPTVPEAPDAS